MIWFPILHRVNRRRGVNNNKDSPTDAEQNNTLNVLQYSIVRLKWKFKLALAVYGVEHITEFVECLCPDKCSLGRVYGVWSTKTAQYRRIKLSKQNEQEQTSERKPQQWTEQTKVVGWRWPSEASDRHTIVVHWNSFLGHDITLLGHRSSEVWEECSQRCRVGGL